MPKLNSESLKEFVEEIDSEKSVADNKTQTEEYGLKIEALSLQNQNFAQNMEQRRRYADLIFTLVCIWLTLVIIIIIACGKGSLKLSDTVLSILLGTTTTNVGGFLLLVVKYLFNVENPGAKEKPKKKKKKKK